MHSNLRTCRCAYCGEPTAPQEGVPARIDGRQCFVHAGCQQDDARHADHVVCEDALDFVSNFTYDTD